MRSHQSETTLSACIGTHTLLNPKKIVRLEAERNYTRIYQSDGRDLLVARTLKLVEQNLLPFVPLLRVNRGDAINLDYVLNYYPTGEILLHDQTRIEISRRKLKVVKALIKQHRFLTGHS
ncbi:LytTR family DNA-binding domain-containing protein [Telluribacter sp.]|jgi:two-component system LytT family response regulator|uniref:LytTR family DNA-binding domain-containing protein n=1 Tax=Telluribacter sp. TaxID=1978767 RepID=UPI002E121A6D|nr:LytTR family DNA-binding domain-containing protein [Telluribacter sp.]